MTLKGVGFCIPARRLPSSGAADKMLDWCKANGLTHHQLEFKDLNWLDYAGFWLPKLKSRSMKYHIELLPSRNTLAAYSDFGSFEALISAVYASLVDGGFWEGVSVVGLGKEMERFSGITVDFVEAWCYRMWYHAKMLFDKPLCFATDGGSTTEERDIMYSFSDVNKKDTFPNGDVRYAVKGSYPNMMLKERDIPNFRGPVWLEWGYGLLPSEMPQDAETTGWWEASRGLVDLFKFWNDQPEIERIFLWLIGLGYDTEESQIHGCFNSDGSPKLWLVELVDSGVLPQEFGLGSDIPPVLPPVKSSSFAARVVVNPVVLRCLWVLRQAVFPEGVHRRLHPLI